MLAEASDVQACGEWRDCVEAGDQLLDFDHYLFADESGHIRTDRFFLVGVLRVPGRWQDYEDEVDSICQRHGYNREIKYSKADALSIAVKKDIVDWVLGSDVFFRCLVKDLNVVDWSYYEPRKDQNGISKEELFFNHSYKTVVSQCMYPGKKTALLMDHKTRRQNDNCLDYMGSMIYGCNFVGEADSKKYRLLQVADLLTGCVNGDINGVQNLGKAEVIKHFKDSIGVQTLRQTCRHERANIWHWTPPANRKSPLG